MHFGLLSSHILILQKHVVEVAVTRPVQRLGHDISNIVFSADALNIDHSPVGMLLDQVVPEVNVLGHPVSHHIAGLVHCSLVVHEYAGHLTHAYAWVR